MLFLCCDFENWDLFLILFSYSYSRNETRQATGYSCCIDPLTNNNLLLLFKFDVGGEVLQNLSFLFILCLKQYENHSIIRPLNV